MIHSLRRLSPMCHCNHFAVNEALAVSCATLLACSTTVSAGFIDMSNNAANVSIAGDYWLVFGGQRVDCSNSGTLATDWASSGNPWILNGASDNWAPRITFDSFNAAGFSVVLRPGIDSFTRTADWSIQNFSVEFAVDALTPNIRFTTPTTGTFTAKLTKTLASGEVKSLEWDQSQSSTHMDAAGVGSRIRFDFSGSGTSYESTLFGIDVATTVPAPGVLALIGVVGIFPSSRRKS